MKNRRLRTIGSGEGEGPPEARRRRLNGVDLVVLLVVLGLLALGAYKLLWVNRGLEAQEGKIEYQVLVENIRQPTVEAYQPGQMVKELQTNIDLGTVASKSATPYRQPVNTLEGKIVMAEVPERFDLLVTIHAPAVISPANITVGNKEIKVGDRISIKTQTAASTGVVYQVIKVSP